MSAVGNRGRAAWSSGKQAVPAWYIRFARHTRGDGPQRSEYRPAPTRYPHLEVFYFILRGLIV